jgi:hypothetical protein
MTEGPEFPLDGDFHNAGTLMVKGGGQKKKRRPKAALGK